MPGWWGPLPSHASALLHFHACILIHPHPIHTKNELWANANNNTIKDENGQLPTWVQALTCKRALLVLMRIQRHELDHPCVYIFIFIFFSVWICSRSRPELTDPASRPLTCGLISASAVLVCSEIHFLTLNSLQVIMKHKGHKHMDLIQCATLGLKFQQGWKKHFPLENVEWNWTKETFAVWSTVAQEI